MTRTVRVLAALPALALAAGVAAAAADVFQQYGLDRPSWAGALLGSLTDGVFHAPPVSAKLKGLPPAQRAAAVRALGAAAKAWVGTPEFRERYAKEHRASLPDDLRPPRPASEIEASMRAEMRKGLTEMEAAVKGLQGDARKQAEAALTQVRGEYDRQAAGIGKAASEQAVAEKARYEAAVNRPPDPGALSADPRVSLRKALSAFLRETSDVDFAAETREGTSRARRFARKDLEAKPRSWKMCYRAGREACDAARAFATEWLAELK